MTREQFLDLVREPSSASQLAPNSLNGFIQQFPYCQPLRMLQLRQLRDTNSVHYSQQLKITSAYAPDRTRLFNLMHEKAEVIRQKNEYSSIDTVSDLLINTDSESIIVEANVIPIESVKKEDDLPIVSFVEESTFIIPTIEVTKEEISPIAIQNITEEPKEEKTIPLINSIDDVIDDSELSPQQIIELRLKELNLWKEETSEFPVINIPSVEEIIQEDGVKLVSSEIVTYPTNEFNDKENEILSINEETIVEHEIKNESANDELEELIQESILQIKNKTDDYFASQDILIEDSSIEEQEEEIEIIENPISTSPVIFEKSDWDPIVNESEKEESLILEKQEADFNNNDNNTTPLNNEVHSFTEWLHAKKLNESQPQVDSNIKKVETVIEKEAAPAIILNTITEEINVTPLINISSLKTEVDLTNTEVEKIVSPIFNTPEKNESKSTNTALIYSKTKMIYVKDKNAAALEKISIPNPKIVIEQPEIKIVQVSETPIIPFHVTEPVVARLTPELKVSTSEEIEARKQAHEHISTAPIPDIPKSKTDKVQLIDKFIKQDPRITPSKSVFYSPVNMARKSIIEPEDIVSETLAKIYAQQGNVAKAESLYKKLALKFPEKSRYFASLIEDLKSNPNT